jgi:hypothetical protein
MTERRRHPRLRTYIGAQIVFNQRRSVLDCLVRNLTVDGARVEFTNTALVPEAFDLIMPYRNEVRRVRVRWRAKDVAGLALEPLDAHASLEDSGRMRALEQEVASLRRRNAELQPWG